MSRLAAGEKGEPKSTRFPHGMVMQVCLSILQRLASARKAGGHNCF